MKRIFLAALAVLPLFAVTHPVQADQNRPFSSSEHGCEFFTGMSYDDDVTFYLRDMRFVTLNPEWKTKYRSARCVRYCKAFLYEQPNLQVFSSSFDRMPAFKGGLDRIQSMKIYCANDGDMHKQELKETKEAAAQKEALKNSGKKMKILQIDNLTIKKQP